MGDEQIKPYWCFVCVRLRKPIVYVDIDSRESVHATGYWMRLGVTAPSRQSVRQIVKKVVHDGLIQWQQSTLEPIGFQQVDPAVAEKSDDVTRLGVWYTGGRAYFVD